MGPWRVSGIAGLLFVVLSLSASVTNVQPPPYNEDPAALAAWFAANGPRYRAGHFMAGIAFLVFYFPFYAGFCERLRQAEGRPAIWSRVAWAGAIMSPAAGTVSGSFIVGAALLGTAVSPEAAALGAAGGFYAYIVSGALSGIVMLAAAMVILRTGVFPRWSGWSGAFIGVIAIVGCAAVVEGDPAGFFAAVNGIAWLLYFLWMAALSLALMRVRES
jgi:hypothetical protein